MASCSCLSFLGLHALANREFSMQQIFNTPQQMHDKLCCKKGCPCTDMRVQEHESTSERSCDCDESEEARATSVSGSGQLLVSSHRPQPRFHTLLFGVRGSRHGHTLYGGLH